MDASPSDQRVVRSIAHRIHVRWLGLFALLLSEIVLLTVRFDTKTLQGAWPLLERLTFIGQVGFDILAATVAIALLVLGRRLPDELSLLNERVPDHRWWVYLLAHITALAAWTCTTIVLLEGGPRSNAAMAVATVCWVSFGSLVLLTWICCIIPPGAWILFLQRWPGVIMASLALGLAAWVAGLLANLMWEPLAGQTFWLVRNLLEFFSDEVVSSPAKRIIGTRSFHVEIAQQCSGYQGIGLMMVLIGAFLLISRRALRFPRALWLLPLACLLSYLANAVRIVILILLGTHVSRNLAAGAFHSRAGVLLFLVVGFALIAVALRLPLFLAIDGRRNTDECGSGGGGAGASEAYLYPLLALVGITLVTGTFSTGRDLLYPLGSIGACFLIWRNRRFYQGLHCTFSLRAVAIGVVVFAIWTVLLPGKSGEAPRMGPAGLGGPGLAAWIIVRGLGTVLVAPLVEELAFRGYLARRLMSADFQSVPLGAFAWSSFLISSALFGIFQEHWIAGTLAGMFYALALYSRREFSDAVLAHSVTNALVVAFALRSGNWSLWI